MDSSWELAGGTIHAFVFNISKTREELCAERVIGKAMLFLPITNRIYTPQTSGGTYCVIGVR